MVDADGLTGVQEQQHQDLSRLTSGDADVPLPVRDEQRPKHPEPNAVHAANDIPSKTVLRTLCRVRRSYVHIGWTDGFVSPATVNDEDNSEEMSGTAVRKSP
ncbi:hypothetical protein GCM10010178_50620 [Lentzea flava]|uniref:Uncharacterized protein n=1 Tax=Lentzea flava TaxID=103732 RepID=A0ABQ2USM2_9PSEU|nr:hypothetical protein GCM10010178_50620 [Lentzea flava]